MLRKTTLERKYLNVPTVESLGSGILKLLC